MSRPMPSLRGLVRLIGPRWSPKVHELKDFLSRSRIRFEWFDPDRDPRPRAWKGNGVADGKQALVLFPDGSTLVDPDIRTLADRLGLDTEPDFRDWDLVVIGGGPAGIAASIQAGSEGLRTIVVEQAVLGGQATYSASIENYPGFPEGMSGSELAGRAVRQAERFGVEVVVTRRAIRLDVDNAPFHVTLDDGTQLVTLSAILAMGVSFRWLEAPGCARLVGAGIYYGAASAEAGDCSDQDIYILGGGNSAGQAALLLARYARRVTLLNDEPDIAGTMSAYLIERIAASPDIHVQPRHTVTGAEGDEHLESLTLHNLDTGEARRVSAGGLFVFIGATPHTEWLPPAIRRDDDGFILSGTDVLVDGRPPAGWPLERLPFDLETSTPGIFVAGDVRRGSVKRLTSAAGEGASAVAFVHRYLEVRTR